MPFAAAAGDHQTANAQGLVEAGAAVLVSEEDLAPAVLAEQVEMILGRPEAAMRMAQNAVARGRPDAAERLATLVEETAAGTKIPTLNNKKAET